jgi:protoporphyrin/coproporphyrin ferrochelatase
MSKAYLIVNFGGPRDQQEIRPFLQELLKDQEVIRSGWPQFWHNIIFSRIAKNRARQVAHDYATIGGGSPIYAETEEVARQLRHSLDAPVLTFHRYLPSTHATFIQQIESLTCCEIIVFPMFPQFSYATTGSIARWLHEHLRGRTARKIRWIKSYPTHPAFVTAIQEGMNSFLQSQQVSRTDVFFLFSAHGLPKTFICTGDLYQSECERSHAAVMAGFATVPSLLSYQSKFGRGEWLRPYTEEISANILQYHQGKSSLVIVPISFTSDHIETLFEIEQLYLPVIRKSGIQAYRCPALGLQKNWIGAISAILRSEDFVGNDMLIRHKRKTCHQACCSCN